MAMWLRTGWRVGQITEQEPAKVAELISLTVTLKDNSLVCNQIMLVTLQQDFDIRSEFAGEVKVGTHL
jgi:hypothetical protein